jgi:hypothetical protein
MATFLVIAAFILVLANAIDNHGDLKTLADKFKEIEE